MRCVRREGSERGKVVSCLHTSVRRHTRVAAEARPGALGGGELGPDIARQVGVGGFPPTRLGGVVDEVAQFGDDRLLGLAVQPRNVRQIDPEMVCSLVGLCNGKGIHFMLLVAQW